MLINTIESKFNSLFKSLYCSLCKYAYSFLKDHDSSEDVVQSALIFLWEQKRELIGTDNAKYYLFTTVKNNSISILRKSNRLYNLIDFNSLKDVVYEDAENDQQEIFSAQELVEEAISGLPPKCAKVFKYSKMYNFTYKEIAIRMGISVKTVENHMGKAIKYMRDFKNFRNIELDARGFFDVVRDEEHRFAIDADE